MHQFLLDALQSPDWTVARAARVLKNALARLHDPVVTYRLNGRPLALPLSHSLPWDRRALPLYSDNLRRLAGFLRERDGALRMIDAGANVGDSWALAGPRPGDAFLLVEGSARFFALLERNTRGDPGATRVLTLLSDAPGEVAGALVPDRGNARLAAGGARAASLAFQTVDQLVRAHPAFRRTTFLKVDVEGFDRRVLRGATELLREAAPVVMFEHQPGELARAGEDDAAVFRELEAVGYAGFLLYDQRGLLLGAAPDEAGPWLDDALRYARAQDYLYYDVVAFPARAADARAAFLARERAFYDARG